MDAAPWFADAAPGLLTNRTIRNYLDTYTQQQWPHVVKLTLLHGILSLSKQYSGQQLTVAQLREVVEKGATSAAVERSIPTLQRQILGLQQQLEGVYDELEGQVSELLCCRGMCGMEGKEAWRPGKRVRGCGRTASEARLASASSPLHAHSHSRSHKSAHRYPSHTPAVVQAQPRRPQVTFSMPPAPAQQALQERASAATSPGAPSQAQWQPQPLLPPRNLRPRSPVQAPKPPTAWRDGQPSGYVSPPRRQISPVRRAQGVRVAQHWLIRLGPCLQA